MAVIGALQSSIILCGALLRPIIIKPRGTHEAETHTSSPKELETLNTQEGACSEDSATDSTSPAQNTSHSLDNELTGGSVSTGDSGVQSLNSSPEERTLLDKGGRSKTEQKSVENNTAEIKEVSNIS